MEIKTLRWYVVISITIWNVPRVTLKTESDVATSERNQLFVKARLGRSEFVACRVVSDSQTSQDPILITNVLVGIRLALLRLKLKIPFVTPMERI